MDLLLDTIKIFLGHEVVAKPGGWLFGGGRQVEVKRISFLWGFREKGCEVFEARRSSKKILKYPI